MKYQEIKKVSKNSQADNLETIINENDQKIHK